MFETLPVDYWLINTESGFTNLILDDWQREWHHQSTIGWLTHSVPSVKTMIDKESVRMWTMYVASSVVYRMIDTESVLFDKWWTKGVAPLVVSRVIDTESDVTSPLPDSWHVDGKGGRRSVRCSLDSWQEEWFRQSSGGWLSHCHWHGGVPSVVCRVTDTGHIQRWGE